LTDSSHRAWCSETESCMWSSRWRLREWRLGDDMIDSRRSTRQRSSSLPGWMSKQNVGEFKIDSGDDNVSKVA
jgi:hypothetical protein